MAGMLDDTHGTAAADTDATDATSTCSTTDTTTNDGASTLKVGFNVLNTIIGSGVVCLPYALHNAGFGFGLVMLCIIAVMSQFALYALVVSGKRTGTAHFSTVTQAAMGPFGYHILNYSMVIDMVGTVILYLMLVGDLVTSLCNIYFPARQLTRAEIIIAVSIVFILPQLFFRNTGPLAKLSIVSILCLPYIILVVAVRAPMYSNNAGPEFSFFGPRVLPAMGVLAFTYSSCHAAFPNYLGLKDRSVGAWVRASSSATLGASIISGAFALVGYLSFGNSAQPNILANFPDSDNYVNFGRLLFAVSMLLTTPMAFYPIRDTVTEMLKIDPSRYNVSRVWESLCTVILFAFCAVVAVMITDLGLAYELIGAFSSSVINFLLPALIYLWAGTDVSFSALIRRWRDDSSIAEQTPLLVESRIKPVDSLFRMREVALWALAWVVAAFGMWVMVLGTYNVGSGK
ncbi:hypothetical protein GGI26_003632 [Coemansia sp. RSA 1358]|nr:hypothetical protein GGI26_003632 [Coemansia sp. RSA 1358]